jgi:trimethylamine--corrinoid protein Co-methyltransferase
MALKGYKRKYKPLELLSEEEVKKVHYASLDILREIGVKFESKWALDFFKKNDCIVDKESKIVKFPEGLVEEVLRKAPSTFRMKGRDEEFDTVWNEDTLYFQDCPAMRMVDIETSTTKIPTKEEYIDYLKILDALPTCHQISNYPYFGFEGIPEVMAMPEMMALKLKYSKKSCGCPYIHDAEIFEIKMAQIAVVELMGFSIASAPLAVFDSAVQSARRHIDAGNTLGITVGSVFGSTAPVTIAGGIAQANATNMAIIALIQLIQPGHNVIVWNVESVQNMETGAIGFGEIGNSISIAIFNQMWRYYGLPAANAFPGFCNAKVIDFQSGYERGIGAIISALSGASMDQLHGCILGELSSHPIQAVLDDDIAGMVGRFIEGELVNDETLAVDVVREVGPLPGHYLSQDHTRKWYTIEQHMRKSADLTANYSDWQSGGQKIAIDLAKERTDEILKNHQPPMLDSDKCEEIDKVLEEARKYYKEKDMI